MPNEPAAIQQDTRPRRRFYPRLRLRTLLLLVLLVGLPLAWFGNWLQAARRQRAAVVALESDSAHVSYDFGKDAQGVPRSHSPRAKWLIGLFGVDAFHRVEGVSLVEPRSNRTYDALAEIEVAQLYSANAGDEVLAAVARHPNRLSKLDLWGAGVTDAGMARLGPLPRLEELILNATPITGESLRHLHQSTQLKSFYAGGTRFSDAGLQNLQECLQLRTLSIGSRSITDAGLKSLEPLTKLQSFILVADYLDQNATLPDVTDTGMQHLRNLVQLDDLAVRQCPRVGATSLEWLAGLTRLISLDLDHCGVSDDTIEPISKLKELNFLGLAGCKITAAGLRRLRLGELKQLDSIVLNPSYLDDEAVEVLSAATSLTSLSLADAPVTDAGVAHLARLKNLQILNLSNTRVTDACLPAVARIRSLSILNLRGCSFSDSALGELAKMPELGDLHLDKQTITPTGLAKLLAAPQLRSLSLDDCVYGDEIVPVILASKVEHLTVAPGKLSDQALAQLEARKMHVVLSDADE